MFVSAIGHSDEIDSLEAIDDALNQCHPKLKGYIPNAAIIFSNINYDHRKILNRINEKYPGIKICGCTTGGEISSLKNSTDDSLVLSLFYSDKFQFDSLIINDISKNDPLTIKRTIDSALSELSNKPSLCIFTGESISRANYSILTKELYNALGKDCFIFGGLAGDDWRFNKSYQFHNCEPYCDSISMLLISGDIKIGHSFSIGWEPIGQKTTITNSKGNIAKTIGDKSAYEFYRHYLGNFSIPPGEYPLAVFEDNNSKDFYLRAPFHLDEKSGEVLFSGDIPENSTVQITETTRTKLINNCSIAAIEALETYKGISPQFTMVISCSARKQILGTKTNHEILEISKILPPEVAMSGFYSYGEIITTSKEKPPYFHNETIILLVIGEE